MISSLLGPLCLDEQSLRDKWSAQSERWNSSAMTSDRAPPPKKMLTERLVCSLSVNRGEIWAIRDGLSDRELEVEGDEKSRDQRVEGRVDDRIWENWQNKSMEHHNFFLTSYFPKTHTTVLWQSPIKWNKLRPIITAWSHYLGLSPGFPLTHGWLWTHTHTIPIDCCLMSHLRR